MKHPVVSEAHHPTDLRTLELREFSRVLIFISSGLLYSEDDYGYHNLPQKTRKIYYLRRPGIGFGLTSQQSREYQLMGDSASPEGRSCAVPGKMLILLMSFCIVIGRLQG